LSDKIIIAYKSLLEGKEFNEEEEGVFGWFMTMVLPIIHLASQANLALQSFAFQSGVPQL